MRVALLAGGTGGAKLAHGFAKALDDPADLSIIVNVADDTERHGLLVSPDVDTILYTLSGLVDTAQGWGVARDTFTALDMLERLGEETWFRIGDADLALHVRRNHLLREGLSLTDAVADIARALGVRARLLPATDDPIRTRVLTDEGELDFQEYFVRHRQADEVRGLRFDGVEGARPTAAVRAALAGAELVVIGPSNPLVSIGPILAIPGMGEAVVASGARRIGVSGIVAGKAIRGPADRMLGSLGHEASARGVARLYAGLVDTFVIDEADADLAPSIGELGMEVAVLPTVMRTDADRAALAAALLELAAAPRT
jgi:LPPG:FO 2-phospho-L-lactate transferase